MGLQDDSNGRRDTISSEDVATTRREFPKLDTNGSAFSDGVLVAKEDASVHSLPGSVSTNGSSSQRSPRRDPTGTGNNVHFKLPDDPPYGPPVLELDTSSHTLIDSSQESLPILQDTYFPQLSNNPLTTPGPKANGAFFPEDRYDDTSLPQGFDRTQTNLSYKGRENSESEREDARRRMHKFTLYETATRYYIVGADLSDSTFRILKIDRTADEGELSITEDEVLYSRDEMNRLLATIEDGNRSSGGLKEKCPFWGLLGFIRFTGPYYMLLITKRSIVATIGGHYVYQIDNTELVPLTTVEGAKKPENNPEEARFLSILGNLDLTRSFYFSYSYDITRTLQHNITRAREDLAKGIAHAERDDYNDMFAWNHYLLTPACENLKNTFDWCLPIVHGYVDQSSVAVYGRTIYITIIARRSRYFAGARFLKRGANDLGYVANDVETEQIVSEMTTTSFHWPQGQLYANPTYTSYVQHRGSIPLFWTQENNAATPKPPIELNLVDPFFSAAALHFDNMFLRYGSPIIALNLVKARERTPRESLLLKEYTQAIEYLNQFLPREHQIRHIAWDMSRASKGSGLDVIDTLEAVASHVLDSTGFFHNGSNERNPPKVQNGVCRTNCIDCLDRTNAAQFIIGKRALGHQLHALGVISETNLEFDTDAVNLFTHMWHDHGDTIAVQYAGSHLVNTMETYRKINAWTSRSRDMIENFRRYYTNSFLDAQRQEAYNLFLGNYIFAQGQPMLWDLSTDYYLHHADPRADKQKRSYTKWWTPQYLEKRTLPSTVKFPDGKDHQLKYFDNYWEEYYRPRVLSNFLKLFSYNINSTLKYIPLKMTKEGKYDLSPFRVRTTPYTPKPARKRKNPLPALPFSIQSTTPTPIPPPPIPPIPALEPFPPPSARPKDSLPRSQWPIDALVTASIAPTVSPDECDEYARYVAHPLSLPLVVHDEMFDPSAPAAADDSDFDDDVLEYVRYVRAGVGDTGRAGVGGVGAAGAGWGFGGWDEAEVRGLYEDWARVPEDPLSVREGEERGRRYRAYWKAVGGRWILGGRGGR